VQNRLATLLLASAITAALGAGCSLFLNFGGPEAGSISYAGGELLSREPHPLPALDGACRNAIQAMGYDRSEATREEEGRIVWQATTAGGDRVEIRLAPIDEQTTELRIRIGVLGDEARSRLLLEQIHQSL
jgi:hypothetical protein